MRRPALLIPPFLLTALFFGWKTYAAWVAPPEALPPPPQGAIALPAFAAAPDEAAPPDPTGVVAAIVVRPLFRPDRRPFQDNAAAVVPQRNYESELSRFTLLGVLLLGEDRKGIVVGRGAAGREERWEVAPGDALPGFTVKEVGTDGVTLAADNKEFLLPLYAGGPKGPAGQAPIRTETAPPRQPASAAQPPAARQPAPVRPAPAPAPFPAPALAPSPAPDRDPALRQLDLRRERIRQFLPGRR